MPTVGHRLIQAAKEAREATRSIPDWTRCCGCRVLGLQVMFFERAEALTFAFCEDCHKKVRSKPEPTAEDPPATGP